MSAPTGDNIDALTWLVAAWGRFSRQGDLARLIGALYERATPPSLLVNLTGPAGEDLVRQLHMRPHRLTEMLNRLVEAGLLTVSAQPASTGCDLGRYTLVAPKTAP